MAQAILMGKDGGGSGKGIKVLEASTSNVIDFNTLTEPGRYLIKNCSDEAGTTINSPYIGTNNFTMDVMLDIIEYHDSDGNTYQTVHIAFASSQQPYRRTKFSDNSWSAWSNEIYLSSIKSSGIFEAQVKANATSVQALETAQIRNIYAGTTDLTAGTSPLATGDIYFCYE